MYDDVPDTMIDGGEDGIDGDSHSSLNFCTHFVYIYIVVMRIFSIRLP